MTNGSEELERPVEQLSGLLKLISVLQNEVSPESEKGWYYKDDTGEIRGPYPPMWMNRWMKQGYFDELAEVRYGNDGAFLKLKHMFKDGSTTFLVDFKDESSRVRRQLSRIIKG
mmetsp:Transcript_12787/g.16888  ORF Transcript_12787/g.16888 Transcript_12787/m.16888 type:complete len:114 (-) Transcript_12787:491-832(-)|eukprot:CAMPEP_0185778204 /NCGR_PEP_ID=MMETSP1174-20130828/91854_1 /TAXON_ID=35687 /ORGANISM="Dictyocha speculum, Strain CCMP1381" /LENGTH=113 /DNA_ID=CAMNT_0028466835 /DNA_START=12 /DNA_END=353 /DNA_ORIENTATION=+